MSSETFKCVGKGEVLAYLRSDMKKATRSLLIIGPWLDDFFAEQVVKPASRRLQTRVLVRPEAQVDELAWARTMAALSAFAEHWPRFEARHLERLHAKCICIDAQTFFVGSANWYRYSLETSEEVVLRGRAEHVEGGLSQLESLWDRGEALDVSPAAKSIGATASAAPTGIGHEVLDPLASEALKANPKAFVLGKKGLNK